MIKYNTFHPMQNETRSMDSLPGSYTCQTDHSIKKAQWPRTTAVFHPAHQYIQTAAQTPLPTLRLHPLNLLHSLLEREAEQLSPPRPPQLFAQSTPAHMKPLTISLVLNLIGSDSNLQVPNSGREIHAPLRFNVNLATQRRPQLQLRLAVCQLCGLSAPG